MKKKIKFEIADFVVEVFSVFLGITIAFALNNWTENRSKREAETHYLSGILKDLESERLQVVSVLEDITYRDSLNMAYQEKLIDRSMNSAEFFQYAKGIGFFDRYQLSNTTFKALEASGKLDLVSDQSLLFAMVAHYAHASELAKADDRYEEVIIDKYEPYVIEHLDVRDFIRHDSTSLNYQKAIQDVKFSNIVLPLAKFNSQRKVQYERFLTEKIALIAQIEARLK
jgi:hypothetical protein